MLVGLLTPGGVPQTKPRGAAAPAPFVTPLTVADMTGKREGRQVSV